MPPTSDHPDQIRSPAPMPDVTNVVDSSAHGAVIQAGIVHGDIHMGTKPTYIPPSPMQLPLPPRRFVNRVAELARLRRLVTGHQAESTPAVVVICGPTGVGKTGFALTWSRQVAGQFPDGQLYARLGSSPAERPAAWIGRWLRALGVPPECVPADAPEQAMLWRTVTACRRLLIVIDDAGDEVLDMLPGSGASLVVITTRATPPQLRPISTLLELGPLDDGMATTMLHRLIHPDSDDDQDDPPPVVARLARRCGGLPLRIAAIAGRLAQHPQDAAGLSAELDQLEDVDMPEVEVSYAGLSPQAARLYRLVGLHPGPEVAVPVAAAALGTDDVTARALLEQVNSAGLLIQTGHDRWRLHDLHRRHAHAKACQDESEPERKAALLRVLTYYRDAALAARAAAASYLDTDVPAQAPRFSSPQQALAWLDAEHINLVAAVQAALHHRWGEHAWQIVHGMWPLCLHFRPSDWVAIERLGLQGARRARDPKAEARMLDRLGAAQEHVGALGKAIDAFTEARDLWTRLDQPHKIAGSLRRIAGVLAREHLDEATSLFTQAAEEHRRLGEPRHRALALIGLGDALTRSHRPAEAVGPLREAIELFDGLRGTSKHDPYNRARAETGLGVALTALGEDTAAREHLKHALAEMQRLASPHGEATVLDALAALLGQCGQHTDAGDLAECAQQIRTGAARYGLGLGSA